MSAQAGSSILLGYGPQGAQQDGAALVLGYIQPAVNRKIASGITAPWSASALLRTQLAAPHEVTRVLQPFTDAPWQRAAPLDRFEALPWVITAPADDRRVAPWGGPYTPTSFEPAAPWAVAMRTDEAAAAPWGRFERLLQIEPESGWGVSRAMDEAALAPWGAFGRMQNVLPRAPWGMARVSDLDQAAPWSRFTRPLSPGWMVVVPSDPGPVPDALFYILPARFYMTVHNLYAERLPDSADVPIYEATIGADAGSFAWSFTASGPPALFDLLAPVDGLPAQIRIMVDGIAFVFAVESRRRTEKFGQRAVSIAGRSATALVGAPWQRETARSAADPYTAQQLAAAALDLSGVALDWGLTDWLVPAGAWSHQGTPLAAVMAIAQAAGGYVLSHRSAPTLLTRHPYPTAPWSWGAGAADVELAPDALITVAAEERGGNDINAVYASGTTTGVLARVLRTGTAGDKLAAMVTDPLITHVDAARQRGLAVLGAAGAKQAITLELPVLTGAGGDPGILDVGQLVQINAATPWRARVRAVSVSARMASVRQSVTLERHLEMEEV